jgi:hypothetical protein
LPQTQPKPQENDIPVFAVTFPDQNPNYDNLNLSYPDQTIIGFEQPNFNYQNAPWPVNSQETGTLVFYLNDQVTEIPLTMMYSKAKISTLAGHTMLEKILEQILNSNQAIPNQNYLNDTGGLIGN